MNLNKSNNDRPVSLAASSQNSEKGLLMCITSDTTGESQSGLRAVLVRMAPFRGHS